MLQSLLHVASSQSWSLAPKITSHGIWCFLNKEEAEGSDTFRGNCALSLVASKGISALIILLEIPLLPSSLVDSQQFAERKKKQMSALHLHKHTDPKWFPYFL